MNIFEWLGAKAPGFNDLSNEERDAIMQFALLWSFFEAMALDNSASVRAITRLVQSWESNGQLDVDAFTKSLAYFKERYFNNGTATEKFQGLHFRPRDKRALVEAVLTEQNTNPEDCVAALLIIVYRIRNNLFHGEKWAYDIQGQLGNFTNANAILMTAMEI